MTTSRPGDVCPWCSASGRSIRGTCLVCERYYALEGWAHTPRPRHLVRWCMVGLAAAAALGAWFSGPFLPDPITLLFRHPTTQLSSTAEANQWPMWGLDLQQRRYVEEALHPVAGQRLWSVELGIPTRSAPVVVDDVVYIGGHFQVLALDARTGRRLWARPMTGPVETSLAVAGDLLYVGLQDWRVLALERQTGQTRWEFSMQNPVAGAAAVAEGIVYIGSLDGFLYALDAATGKRLWQFKTEDQALSPPALADNTLFVSATDGSLYALHPRTGQLRLRFRTPERLQDTPVVANGLVYFPAGGYIYAVAAGARELPGQYALQLVWAQLWIWQFPVPRPPAQPGSTWRLTSQAPPRKILAAPAVAPDLLYVGDINGRLYAHDAVTGAARWQFQAGAALLASPLIVGPTVYVGAADGVLYALDRTQGTLRGQLALGAPLQTPPVFASQRLYLQTKDGWLHAIE